MAKIPPPRMAMVDKEGRVAPEWYRWFVQFERDFEGSGAQAGSGISVTGETIAIAQGGVTTAMMDDAPGVSVIGRYQNSTGAPNYITAGANGRVLMRVDDILVFREITPGMGTIGDGDYGDISVSAGVWSIDAGTVGTTELAADAVTFAKLQNIATDRLLGRDTAGSGDAEELTVGGGIEFTGSGIQTTAFTGDATKAAGGTVLTLATVNANVGTFGSATQVAQVTANGKGLVTAAANVAIAIPSTQVTDFAEAVDDRVSSLVQNGTGITWSYNDGSGTLTPTVTITQYTDELAQDAVGTILTDSATIAFTYNDGGPSITASVKNTSITAGMLALTTGSGAVVLATTPELEGPVGIGNAAATFDLEIFGTGAANMAFRSSDTSRASFRAYVNGTSEAGKIAFGASDAEFEIAGVFRMTLSATGLDIVGQARCDSFRIDQTPTAETPAATHTITVSANGTNYKLLCVAA